MTRAWMMVFSLCVAFMLVFPAAGVSQGPNPVISNLSGESIAYPGYPYQGSVTIENTGDQTSGIFTVILFMRDCKGGDETYTIAAEPVDPVHPDSSVIIRYTGTVPLDLPEGCSSLYAVLKTPVSRNEDQTGKIARLPSNISVVTKPLPDQGVLQEEIISHIRRLTNEYRLGEGLSILEWDESLADIAEDYARELSKTGRLSHTDASGNDAGDRAQKAGYQITKEIEGGVRVGIGENLAYIGTGKVAGVGYVDPTSGEAIGDAFMDGWMESPGHRKNILDPLADRFGAGLALNGEYYYAATEFW